MAPSALRSCKLSAGDAIAIAGQLQRLTVALESERVLSATEIRDTVADQKRKLEECTQNVKIQKRDAKKHRPVATPQSRGPDDRRDSRALTNVDYLARVDAAKTIVLNHQVFRGLIDKLPVDITGPGTQPNDSGVQAPFNKDEAAHALGREGIYRCACNFFG